MDNIEPCQILLLMTVVAYASFLFGRASARGGEGLEERRLREDHEGERIFSALDASKQADIDRLLTEGKLIAAIKEIREATGSGLKEAKTTADYRKRMLTGPA